MPKVIVFEVQVGGINRVITNFDQVETAIKDIKALLKTSDFGTSRYNELQKALGALKQTQQAVNAETREQQQQFVKTADAGRNSYRALNAELVLMRKAFKDLSEADRDGKIGQGLLVNINALDAKLKGIDARMGLFQRNVGNYTGALQSFFGSASSLLGGQAGGIVGSLGQGVTGLASALTGNLVGAFTLVGSAVAAAGAQVIKFNAEISDSQANVQKTTGFTTERVQELTEQLKTLDTRTDLKGLLGISTVLGQLGVEVNQNTVAAIDKLNVALGDDFGGGAELVTDQVGKLKNVLVDFRETAPEEGFLNLGNALNTLSAEGAATAPVITDFSVRIAGLASPLGITAGEILGVSATLQELGTNAERGATGFTRVISELIKQPAEFAKQLGISTEAVKEVDASVSDFTELVNKDLFGAFTLVLGRLKELNLSNTDLSKVLGQLQITGQGEVEVLSKLATSQDLLSKRVNTANRALGNQDSILAEFTAKNTNLAAELDKLGNIISESFVNGGFTNFLRDVVAGVNEWFDSDVRLSDQLVEQQVKINSLAYSITQANTTTDDRIKLIQQLQSEYPEFFANLDAEKVSNEELNQILVRVNDTYSKRIAIIKNNENLEKTQAEVAEQIVDLEQDRARLINEVNRAAIEYNNTHTEQIRLTGDLTKDIAALNNAGIDRISLTRELSTSLKFLKQAEDDLKESQQQSNNVAQLTLEINGRIAQTGGIISEQNVRNLISTSELIVAEKEQIKTLIQKGQAEQAAARALKIREDAQKSLNGVSKEGLDIVLKSTSGPIQQLAVQGKRAADIVRQSIAEIDKIIKGSGSSPTGGTTETQRKKAQSEAKKQLDDLEKEQENIEKVLDQYRERRISSEDKFSDRLLDLRVRNIRDQTEREVAEEDLRYARVVEQVNQENNNLIKIQNEAERRLSEAIANAEELRDTTKSSKVRQEAIQLIKELGEEQAQLETQIAQDNVNRTRIYNETLERLALEHGEKINVIIKKSAERDKAEFKKRQEENFKSVDDQFKNFSEQLERDFKERELAINKARLEALNAVDQAGDIGAQVESINKKFDAEEAASKVQLLTDKLSALQAELALIEAINSQELALGLTPSISAEAIQGLKDKILDIESEITKTQATEADKRLKITDDELKKKLEKQKEHQEQIRDLLLEVATNAANAILNIQENQLDREIAEEEERINAKYDRRVELAGQNSDLIAKIEKDRVLELERLDKQRAESEKELAKKRAIIEGAVAVVKAFATLGPIAGAIAAIGIAASTLFQISEIESQSFATGGFTGRGGRKDRTGKRVAGVVHGGEYVIPEKVLNTPEGAYLAHRAEIMRSRLGYPSRPGLFAVGGLVPPVVGPSSSNVTVVSTTRLDDDQFNLLTQRMYTAVKEGSLEGTVAGGDQVNRTKDRLESLKKRTEI